MTVDIDFSFQHRFRCEVLHEIPNGANRLLYFPSSRAGGGRDGILIRVHPESFESWIGLFAFGRGSCSRVLSLPDPDKICVIAKGAGYLVSVSETDTWEPVKAVPITDVRSIPAAGIVVFANLTELVAYAETGIKWQTKRLAWDGLKIVATSDQTLVGEYWDIRSEANRRFEVDLLTGDARGGIET